MNGHNGREKGGFARVQDGSGIEAMSAEGESIVDFALAADMACLNTFFQYACGPSYHKQEGTESQTDFLLCGSNNLKKKISVK